jgi:ABC-type antimicrobial peptide transport system permease subunit
VAGCGAAYAVFYNLDFTAGGFFPNFRVLPETVGLGLLLSLAIGVLSAVVPAAQAMRLRITSALRKVA